MVCSRATAFILEWASLLDDSHANWRPTWDALLQLPSQDIRTVWFGRAVQLCLGLAADYYHRLLLPCRTFPLLLFWIVWSRPDAECSERARFATDFMSMSEDSIADDMSRKFRCLFREPLGEAAVSGKVPSELWNLLNKLGQMW
eukprot:11027070-Alexandrium_andersonii.AAC.1